MKYRHEFLLHGQVTVTVLITPPFMQHAMVFYCQIQHFQQNVKDFLMFQHFRCKLFLSHTEVNRTYCTFVLGHRQHSCGVSWPAVQNNPIKVCPIGHTQGQDSFHWCPTGQTIVLFDSRVAVLMYLPCLLVKVSFQIDSKYMTLKGYLSGGMPQ